MATCQCRHQTGNFFNFDLPISRRGLFLQDSFFNNSYDHLDSTVRRIMEQWGARDLLADRLGDTKMGLSNNLSRYRQLRTHNLKEEDQAVTVVTDTTTHKIVMDVQDFVNGELKVKVVGEREVMVEGRMETNKGDFAVSSNSFRRKFVLPDDTNMETITSVMSADGVLTISAQRRNIQVQNGFTEIPITIEGTQNKCAAANSQATSAASTNTSANMAASCCTCQSASRESGSQSVSSTQQTHTIPVRLEEDQQRSESVNAGNMSTSMKNTEELQRSSQVSNQQQTATEAKSQTQTSSSASTKTQNVPIKSSNFLPITTRGLFFNDSYFDGIRQDFQNAVNDVVTRWGETKLPPPSWDDTATSLSRYRQLRAHDLRVDNQAINITSDDSNHKIVIDVHDFMEGEVKVVVVGEREVMVEGRKEIRDGDIAVSTNSFRRRFWLPQDTKMQDITSVMSADGILTVIAPRLVKQIKREEETFIPIKVESDQNQATTSSVNSTSASDATARTKEETHSKDSQSQADSTDAQSADVNTSKQHFIATTSTSFQTNAGVSGSEGKLNGNQTVTSNESGKVSDVTNQTTASSVQSQRNTSTSTSLPVTTRGLFFDDSFFKNTWQDFHEAMKDVVSRWGSLNSANDYLTCYRNLRSRDIRDETQAVKSTEDELNYKILVDVHDFVNGGTINVKSVNDREVVVEGQVEREEGGVKFRKHFHRRFVLPRDIYLESVSSVMSADGILTISAPKKPITYKIKEMIIPVSIEEGLHKTESLSKVSEENLEKRRMEEVEAQSSRASLSAKSSSSQTVSQEEQTHHASTMASQQTDLKEHIIPVRLEEESSSKCHQQTSAVTTKSEDVQQQHARQSSCAAEAELSRCVSSTSSSAQGVSRDARSQAVSLSQAAGSREQSVSQGGCVADTKTCVPITRRGDFNSDAFFEDTRRNFTTAVREVLRNTEGSSSSSSCQGDELTHYRSLLRKNPKLENQAVHVEEDEHSLKIILDANDFVGGDLRVEILNGKEIVVEGESMKEEGTSASSLSFRRLFTLPPQADVNAVQSAISSDGILTITTPKVQGAAASGAKSSVTQSQCRMENQGPGTKGWQEKKEREEVNESENSSSRSYSSSYSAQQQYSSAGTF